MRAIVSPEVTKFVDGLVNRHIVTADPHIVERLKVEVENFVNDFATAEEESVGTTELMGIPLTTAMVNNAGFGLSIPEKATFTGISAEPQINSSATELTQVDWDSLKAIHRNLSAQSATEINAAKTQSEVIADFDAGSTSSAADLDAVAAEQKAAAETTATAETLDETKGDGSESN